MDDLPISIYFCILIYQWLFCISPIRMSFGSWLIWLELHPSWRSATKKFFILFYIAVVIVIIIFIITSGILILKLYFLMHISVSRLALSMQILVRLVSTDDHMYPNFMDVMQWLADSNLVEMIVDKLSPSVSSQIACFV